MDRYEVMSVSKREPPLLPLFLFARGRTERGKYYAFTAEKLGSLSTLQRQMPPLDKTSS
jgi:hypothetical protein